MTREVQHSGESRGPSCHRGMLFVPVELSGLLSIFGPRWEAYAFELREEQLGFHLSNKHGGGRGRQAKVFSGLCHTWSDDSRSTLWA